MTATRKTLIIVNSILLLLCAPVLYAQQKGRVTVNAEKRFFGDEHIGSSDVLARVEVLRDELDLMRREMGISPPTPLEISVRNAAPRETYFHAYTLSDKAHQLAFEFTGKPERPLGILLSAETTPVHVYAVVSEALESILSVKKALNIEDVTQELDYEANTSSSQVLVSIIQANRELNNILYQQYSPLDVFEQVSLSINFTSRLLEQFPESQPLPPLPAMALRKTPADVFHVLVRLFDDLQKIAHVSGEETLDLKVRGIAPNSITSSDVYDVAKMVFAELAYFYSLLKDPKPVDEPKYPPHRILPSHVYQQVGLLKSQLVQLHELAEKNPGWLANK